MLQLEFWAVVAAAAVLTIGHYTAPVDTPFWHDLFRRLYYLPIILAGFRYGLAGGLITAAAIALAFLSHVLVTTHSLHVQALEARFEIPLYLVVGAITGLLSDRQRRASEALRRTERLTALGEMAAGMAHEVKNPLAAIRSSAGMLGSTAEGRARELAGIIVAESDRLNQLVMDFLRYARPAPLRRVPVRPSSLLDSCLTLLAPVVEQKHAVVTHRFPPDERDVTADPDQLRQVFLNLLLNALQAIPHSGRIELSLTQSGAETRVSVRDNGPGIPADRLAQVCEPFFTTREGGTGLGLAVARRIVSDHDGRLDIRSPAGQVESTLVGQEDPTRGVSATVVLPTRGR